MATSEIDALHERFMAVAPQMMALAHKIVEAHVPADRQTMEQAEEVYSLLDAAIEKWVALAHRTTMAPARALPRPWTSWFKLRLESAGSAPKPTT